MKIVAALGLAVALLAAPGVSLAAPTDGGLTPGQTAPAVPNVDLGAPRPAATPAKPPRRPATARTTAPRPTVATGPAVAPKAKPPRRVAKANRRAPAPTPAPAAT